jgi:hypothetical protein
MMQVPAGAPEVWAETSRDLSRGGAQTDQAAYMHGKAMPWKNPIMIRTPFQWMNFLVCRKKIVYNRNTFCSLHFTFSLFSTFGEKNRLRQIPLDQIVD